MSLTPLLTATPGSPVTYNPSIAETYSWVPVSGAGRDLFAKATYDVASNALSQNGATAFTDTTLRAGYWSRIDVVTTASVSLTATNWDGNATNGIVTIGAAAAGTTLYGIFTGIKLGSGAVIAYKI
jgi:hypothetical protein